MQGRYRYDDSKASSTLDSAKPNQPVDWQQVARRPRRRRAVLADDRPPGGRPPVTPLVGAWFDDSFVFCTGPTEQKARNLEHIDDVIVTTGVNTWKDGLDVVVEGSAVRVHDVRYSPGSPTLSAKSIPVNGISAAGRGLSHRRARRAHRIVFRVSPDKVLAFGKSPHGQTRFRPL